MSYYVLLFSVNHPNSCPDDTWSRFQQFCYKVDSTAAAYGGASCSDGTLVSIHSQAELDYIAGKFNIM